MEPPIPEISSFKKLVFKTLSQIENYEIDLENQLPLLRSFSAKLISDSSINRIEIELVLDSFLTLSFMGHVETDFLNLLKYYKTISPNGAEFYIREYTKALGLDQSEI